MQYSPLTGQSFYYKVSDSKNIQAKSTLINLDAGYIELHKNWILQRYVSRCAIIREWKKILAALGLYL